MEGKFVGILTFVCFISTTRAKHALARSNIPSVFLRILSFLLDKKHLLNFINGARSMSTRLYK